MKEKITAWDIPLTEKNLNIVNELILEHMPDHHGHGEIDRETGLLRSVEWVLENMLEDNEDIKLLDITDKKE